MKMAPNGILLRYIGYILFVSLSFFVHPSFAQWDFYLSLHREYNTNPFRLPYTESTWFSSAGFGLEYRFDESLFSGYHGSYSNFDNIGDRSFYWHQGYLQGGSDELGWALLGEQITVSDLPFQLHHANDRAVLDPYNLESDYENKKCVLSNMKWFRKL
jgi:hypothetical protein